MVLKVTKLEVQTDFEHWSAQSLACCQCPQRVHQTMKYMQMWLYWKEKYAEITILYVQYEESPSNKTHIMKSENTNAQVRVQQYTGQQCDHGHFHT